MKLYAYNPKSKSAKALALGLGIRRLRHNGPKIVDKILNWGSSAINRNVGAIIINKPEAIKTASNKLHSFNSLNGHVDIPQFTTSLDEANKWLAKGVTVVCRHKLTGHSGEGIEIIKPKADKPIPEAKLYVKYIPKAEEYRIHVIHDNAFFVQRKARTKDVPDDKVNWQVRNHANGFIYAHKDVEVPEEVRVMAVKAVKALGLDFGAVDIIYNEKKNKYFVLEINTAPGLYGTTLEKYVEIFQKLR